MVEPMRALKAFIIALLSLVWSVSFGRRKRCKLKFKWFKHPLLAWLLGLAFDVRMNMNGEIWLAMRERDAVRRRRAEKRVVRILKTYEAK